MIKGKKILAVIIAFFMGCMVWCPSGFAQSEIDALMDVLIAKGIISRGEAVQILEDASNTARIQQINAVEEGPSWLANTTFKGDLRIRSQYENKEEDSREPEHRFRTRLRYGLENTINDKLTVGFRLATGTNSTDGEDPRSTNQTWGDVFSNFEFSVDEAYFDWRPFEHAQLIGGKREVKKLMLRNSDLLWDSDLTFDGGTLKLTTPEYDGLQGFLNYGMYILQQESDDKLEAAGSAWGDNEDNQGNDPWMVHLQPGFIYKTKGDWGGMTLNAAMAYLGAYNVTNQANADILNSNGALATNSLTEDGQVSQDMNVLHSTWSGEYTWGGPKNKTYAIKLLGDYLYNPGPGDVGFLFGAKAGYKKVGKKFGDWQLFWNYRYLEDDAFMDCFSDSDAYSGNTNVKGNEIGLKIGLCKNVTLGFDYYYMEPISGPEPNARRQENLFQTDLVFKF